MIVCIYTCTMTNLIYEIVINSRYFVDIDTFVGYQINIDIFTFYMRRNFDIR